MTNESYTAYSESALVSSIDWLNSLVLGSLAIGLCVIAVAIMGLMMFSGRLPLRQGLRVILGCFILLGAPVIAAGFMGIWQGAAESPSAQPMLVENIEQREPPPPANHDPYAGASLRRD